MVDLTAEATEQYEQQVYALYEQVFNNAQFKLVKLPVCYFREAKKRFGDTFVMTATAGRHFMLCSWKELSSSTA